MTATDFSHVILTRFSIRAYPSTPPHPAAWLEHRLALFETYCLPSIGAQTCGHFSWLIYCDSTTQEWCLDRLRGWAKDVPQLDVVLTSPADSSYREALQRTRPSDVFLISTRADSDDATSIDFVERIQSFAPGFSASNQSAVLLNSCRGFRFDEERGRVYEIWRPHSPHMSMFELLDGPRSPTTVQSGNHLFMQESYPLHVDAGPPTWVQVVHGGNVSNRVTTGDWEVPIHALDGRFVNTWRRTPAPPVPPEQPSETLERERFRQALDESLLGYERDRHHAPGRKPNSDRISEVYKGETSTAEEQRVARDRIDWACGQADGRTLDVGCSQGIATILLARRGITCAGVDPQLDRLESGASDLRLEENATRSRASFLGARATDLPFADESFETVLLGEVLTHLSDPGRVLAECVRVLRHSGRIVITTPFGLHPTHDTMSSFLPASLVELVGHVAGVVSLEIVDRHIRLVAAKDGPGDPEGLLARARPDIEAIVLDDQRRLLTCEDEISDLEEKLERQKRARSRAERQRDRIERQQRRLERRVALSQRRVDQVEGMVLFRFGRAVRHPVRYSSRILRLGRRKRSRS